MTDRNTTATVGTAPDPATTFATASETTAAPTAPSRSGLQAFLVREAPYVAALLLALVGAALTGLRPETSAGYWRWIAPLLAALCVWTQWHRVKTRGGRLRLVTTQALHWGAFFGTMYLIFLPDVQTLVSSVSIALFVLYLTGLALFLVGVYYTAWQLGVIGVILALTVPVVALLDRAWLFLFIAAGLVLGGVYLFFRLRRQTTIIDA